MAEFNGIGKEIIEGGIFERFHYLIPKGGDNYWSDNHSKLLLVGESNYFPDELESISNFKVAENWYNGDKSRLIPVEMKKNVDNWVGGDRFNNLFISMKKVLEEEGIADCKDYLLEEAAYYNYFLRPASVKNINGKLDLGFKKDCKTIDCEVSYSALCGIVKEKDPNIVIFVSKFAWEKFMKFYEKEENNFENVVIDYVYHFSSPRTWKHRSGNGQQKFENLLRDHWVKKNPERIKAINKLQIIHNLLLGKFEKDIYKPSDCGIDKGIYLSCLNLKINDKTFCCQTEIEIKINVVNFWTYFYETDNCEKIPALVGNKYNFTPDFNNDIVVDSIEKLINQIIKDIRKTS